MEKLCWLEIENYRGIKKARLENFGDINVFVGRNNTGKSTILEAIYLNITAQNLDLIGNHPILLIFQRRGARLPSPIISRRIFEIEDIFHYFSYIFYQGDIDKKVNLKSNLADYSLSVFKEYEIPEKLLNFIKDYLKKTTFREKIDVIEPLFVVIDNAQKPQIIVFKEIFPKRYIKYGVEFIIPTLKKQKRKNVIIVDTHWLFYYSIFEEPQITIALRRLERIARIDKEDLVSFLSEQLELEISTVQLGLFDIYVVTKDDKVIPFSLLGDGTKMSLAYFYTLSVKDSHILFEEPENHLHPKLMNRCIDLMLKSSDHNQIFITTHNLEFLQKILKKAKELNKNLRVFSIASLKDGDLEYESYDLDEAYIALNRIGVDLR